MTECKGQKYDKMIVIMDDHAFIDCVFDKCAVFYAGGPCILKNCKWRECQMNWIGSAFNTLAVMVGIGMLEQPEAMADPTLPPPIVPPGTVN